VETKILPDTRKEKNISLKSEGVKDQGKFQEPVLGKRVACTLIGKKEKREETWVRKQVPGASTMTDEGGKRYFLGGSSSSLYNLRKEKMYTSFGGPALPREVMGGRGYWRVRKNC